MSPIRGRTMVRPQQVHTGDTPREGTRLTPVATVSPADLSHGASIIEIDPPKIALGGFFGGKADQVGFPCVCGILYRRFIVGATSNKFAAHSADVMKERVPTSASRVIFVMVKQDAGARRASRELLVPVDQKPGPQKIDGYRSLGTGENHVHVVTELSPAICFIGLSA